MNPRKNVSAKAPAAQRTAARTVASMSPRKANVAQAKTPRTQSPVNQTGRAPSAPPVYRPQPTPHVLQTKAAVGQHPHPLHSPHQTATSDAHSRSGVVQRTAAVVQLARGAKKGAKKSAKKSAAAQQQSKAQRSYNNLCAYRPGWVRNNDITLALVTRFIRDCPYPNGIRGHASGDNSQGEQAKTTNDCLAYKAWHTHNIAAWV
jgi:hypothetical protein